MGCVPSFPRWQVGVGGPFETPLAVADTASSVIPSRRASDLSASNTLIVYTPFLGGNVRSAWPQRSEERRVGIASGSKSTQHAVKLVPPGAVPVVVATVSPPSAEKV